MPGLTPYQTVGPYLSLGIVAGINESPLDDGVPVVIRGRLLDGAGQGIPDGVLEWWHPSFACVQRTLTQEDGGFVLQTVKPGAVPGPARQDQAPHLAVRVLARGIQTAYVTRVYFSDEAANASDPILAMVPSSRRVTIVANLAAPGEYHFDVVVQGDRETVFFDV